MIETQSRGVDGDAIEIQGAREHNLKEVSLLIPRNQFVVITGVSGSGKSTVAFDIVFAEGQRRFLDSMNVYARQFVEQLARPDVDLISGIPPTVSIEQRNSRGGGKSTVATVTEIYHFLRLLFARLGTQFCPQCGVPVQSQTRDQVGRRLEAGLKKHGDLRLLAPVVKNRKGFHTEVAEWAAKHGYPEVRADGKIHPAEEHLRLDRFREHDVEIVTGLLERKGRSGQTAQALIDETLELGHGTLYALSGNGTIAVHSTERSCPQCGLSFGPIDPKMLSYNSPQGWCPACRGFGETFYLPDVERGARAEAIEESWFEWQEDSREICSECQGTRLNPIARAVRLLDLGVKASDAALTIPVAPTIVDISNASVDDVLTYVQSWQLKGRQAEIGRDILPEIRERLKFLREVGLGYLQLGRGATTLSGGEAQRIRLAAQLGSNLSGVLYVLDEPTIGLHARDNEKLLSALAMLKARGNSLIVVEHDEETMRQADYIIDLGPGAGTEGGEVVACGNLKEILAHPGSITGDFLRARKSYPSRGHRRAVNLGGGRSKTPALVVAKARLHNLKNLTVAFPLNRFVCVTGVSGSGKSTLVRDCLLPALREKLKLSNGKSGPLEGGAPSPPLGRKLSNGKNGSGAALSGHLSLRAVYEVDQSPIGRTPRSVPATYVGFFDEIRRLFAELPEARMRGYSASRFSFNSAHGRCPDCLGAGTVKLEMSFMPPAYVRCQTCGASRFNRETLDLQFRGLNIAQVLDLSVAQALEFFGAFQKIARPLQALCDTGLGYVKLGQTSPTLSGGEAQRLKLVTHLLAGFPRKGAPDASELPLQRAGSATACLFVLEEPTIGLHMSDVKKLVEVLQRLVDAGHSVVVIEHNLDLIAEADWVIDLGPEGGDGGGQIVAAGAPEQIVQDKASHTGRYLRGFLGK